MKKIPTLFEREYENHKVIGIHNRITPGLEWVLEGKGEATVKIDGSCCAIIDGLFYRRYDAKKGKKPPAGAIPCCDPDPVTGHWPHWVWVDPHKPEDRWFWEAYANTNPHNLCNGTYEAIGPHFQGNPYNYRYDILIPHGIHEVYVNRSFEGIREYLARNNVEGLVFWLDGEPRCKIKRSDFGFSWPVKEAPYE